MLELIRRLTFWLWPIGIVLMHFTLARIAAFEITIGTLVFLFAVVALGLTERIRSVEVIWVSVILVCTFIGIVFADDRVEFMKSYALLSALLIMITYSIGCRIHPRRLQEAINRLVFLSFLV